METQGWERGIALSPDRPDEGLVQDSLWAPVLAVLVGSMVQSEVLHVCAKVAHHKQADEGAVVNRTDKFLGVSI